jgi:hypothetical protein
MKPLPHADTNHEKFFDPFAMVDKLLLKAKIRANSPSSNIRTPHELEVPYWLFDKLVEQTAPQHRFISERKGLEVFLYKGVVLKAVDHV